MKSKVDLLSQILRDLEIDIGTRDTTTLVLKSLIDSTKVLKAKTSDDFYNQFKNLVELISSTEPKFGVLNYYFANICDDLRKNICLEDCPQNKWKRFVLRRIKRILKEARRQKREILKNSEYIDVEEKTILIHDHSHTVQDALVSYKRLGKHFKVIIAEQSFDKTHSNIERLHSSQIPFQVVPSYMLSHVHDKIDMAFFGAVTLKDTMDFVMAPGTHGVVSEFHMIGVPIYMFIDTAKFSLWKSKKRDEIFMHKHTRTHYNKPIEYERIKYSHDRVPSKLFKKIITNVGALTPEELKKLFKKRLDGHINSKKPKKV